LTAGTGDLAQLRATVRNGQSAAVSLTVARSSCGSEPLIVQAQMQLLRRSELAAADLLND
jgi:hypothetical protein